MESKAQPQEWGKGTLDFPVLPELGCSLANVQACCDLCELIGELAQFQLTCLLSGRLHWNQPRGISSIHLKLLLGEIWQIRKAFLLLILGLIFRVPSFYWRTLSSRVREVIPGVQTSSYSSWLSQCVWNRWGRWAWFCPVCVHRTLEGLETGNHVEYDKEEWK